MSSSIFADDVAGVWNKVGGGHLGSRQVRTRPHFVNIVKVSRNDHDHMYGLKLL